MSYSQEILNHFREWIDDRCIDRGEMFRVVNKLTLSSGATQDYLIEVSSEGCDFMAFQKKSDLPNVDIEYYINSGVSSVGTSSLSAANYNINSTKTANTTVYDSPSISSAGDLQDEEWIAGGTTFKGSIGGSAHSDDLRKMTEGDDVLTRITNNSTQSGEVLTRIKWKDVYHEDY